SGAAPEAWHGVCKWPWVRPRRSYLSSDTSSTNRNKRPRPGAERSPGRGILGARVLAGDPRLTLRSGHRRHRTVAPTHALHGLCHVGESGSTAATRKYTLDPDGPAPPSVYLGLVQGIVGEYVDASAGLVACCTTNPFRARPLGHAAVACPTAFPGAVVIS